MRVYPKAIVFTTKPHSDVRECIASLRGLVVRTITLGKTHIRAILPIQVILLCDIQLTRADEALILRCEQQPLLVSILDFTVMKFIPQNISRKPKKSLRELYSIT